MRSHATGDDASSQALSEALGSSLLLVRLLAVVLAVAFVFSCVFTVNPSEVAVVLRFGKPVGQGPDQILKQGLHWAFPYPIDEIVRIPIGESKVIKATNEWYAVTAEEERDGITPQGGPQLSPGIDGHVITSDGNILHVRATLRYKITKPVDYAFKFSNATNLLRSCLDNSIHWASVRFTADAALRNERIAYRDAIRTHLASLVETLGLGVSIDTLDVEVAAPLYVKTYFDQVIAAEQDKNSRHTAAQGEYDRITREAIGEAQRTLAIGQSISNSLVLAVAADAQSFSQQREDYRKNPSLFRDRLRIATIGRILTNAQDKFFQPLSVDEIRVNLSAEPQTPRKPDPNVR